MAGVDNYVTTRGLREPCGKILPQSRGAESFVKHHDRRGAATSNVEAFVFQGAGSNSREWHGMRRSTRDRGAWSSEHLRKLRAEPEALDLSRRGLRQLGQEFNPARIFVGRQERLDMLFELLSQGRSRRGGLFEYHAREWLDESVSVLDADDRCLQYRGVRNESRFDLRR